MPQGSVLGPNLWNVLYDDLLGIQLPPDVELIAFADDVALLVTASVPYLLEERLKQALGDVSDWLSDSGLELAIDKSEAILLTNRNKHNRMTVVFRRHRFESKNAVKYLGVTLDPRLHFRKHAELAAKKASVACNQLAQILPNLRGPRQRTRKVLATVVTVRLLYEAPFWFPSITAEAMHRMESVHKRAMLRVACCYRNFVRCSGGRIRYAAVSAPGRGATKNYGGIQKCRKGPAVEEVADCLGQPLQRQMDVPVNQRTCSLGEKKTWRSFFSPKPTVDRAWMFWRVPSSVQENRR